MSVISEEFFDILSKKIFTLRGVVQFGAIEEPQHSKCRNRSALIFALESVLHLHRQQFATIWNPLEGRKALEHLLLQTYKWPLTEIRSLSLADVILVLQEQLKPDNLPHEVKAVLTAYRALTANQFYADIREDEWDPDLYLTLPKQQNW